MEKLKSLFAQALNVELDIVTEDLQYNSIPQWDSTAHMILIAALEDHYNIMLDTDDIIDMSSVKKAKEILQKYEIQFS